jgi:CheY-like chemotaxis protein
MPIMRAPVASPVEGCARSGGSKGPKRAGPPAYTAAESLARLSSMNMMTLVTALASQPNVDLRTEKPIEVLYLQDDPDLAELWRLRLELDGYRVRMVNVDALDPVASAAGVPDLLFIDLQALDGAGACALMRLRADRRLRAVPAVIMSTYGGAALRQRGIMLGPLDHVISVPAGPKFGGRPALLDAYQQPYRESRLRKPLRKSQTA